MVLLTGPNTTTVNSSVVFFEECQASPSLYDLVLCPHITAQFNYAVQLLKPILDGDLDSVDPTSAATTRYNDWLTARMNSSVFVQCTSWYRAGGVGKVFSTFPGPATLFWWLTLTPRWADYDIRGKDKGRWARKQRLSGPLYRVMVSICGLVGSLLLAMLVVVSLKSEPRHFAFPGLLVKYLTRS